MSKEGSRREDHVSRDRCEDVIWGGVDLFKLKEAGELITRQ